MKPSRLALGSLAGAPLTHVLRAAWRQKMRLVALAAVAGFAFSVFVGCLSALVSLSSSREQWYRQGNLADLELRVVADDLENFPDFSGIPGVVGITTRMVFPGTTPTRKGETLRVLLIAKQRQTGAPINTLTLLKGRGLDPADPEGVVIERNLASYHGLSVGDALVVKLGKEEVRLHVRGVGTDPEFLLAPANPNLFVPSKGSLGVLFAGPELLRAHFGYDLADSVLLKAAPGADLAALRKRVMDQALTRLNVDWTRSRTEQFSYQYLEKNLSLARIFIPVSVLVLALSAIVITVFIFFQWAVQEKQVLGIFMALGFPARLLARAFGVCYALIACCAVSGGLVCGRLILRGYASALAGSMGLPTPTVSLSPLYVALGGLGIAALFGFAGALAIGKIFSLSPREAMTHAMASEAGPGRLGVALGGLVPSIWLRLALRNIMRNRTVSLMTVIAISLGFGVTTAYFISFTSFIGTVLRDLDRHRWDLVVDFAAPVWHENERALARVPGVAAIAPYTRGVAQAVKGPLRRNISILGFAPEQPWRQIKLLEGAPLSALQPDGLLLEKSAVQELGLKLGDPLTLEIQGRLSQVHLRGVVSGAMPGEAYLPVDYHRQIADLSERSTGMYVRVSGPPQEAIRNLYRHPDVQQVLDKKQVVKEIMAASGQVQQINRMGQLISVTIALLFVFTCVSYTVSQRRGEYQVLRLIGYSDRLITAIIVAEVCLLGAFALCLAVPVGAVVAQYLNSKTSAAWIKVDTILSVRDYLKIFIPGYLLLPLAALPIVRSVLGEPLEASMRIREVA